MLSIARRTAAGAAVLLVIPPVVWFSGWMWQPGQNETWLKALYWITETVTQPWGIITHVLLCGWFLWCLRFRLRAALVLFAILGGAILIGQGGEVVGERSRAGTPSFRRLAGKNAPCSGG